METEFPCYYASINKLPGDPGLNDRIIQIPDYKIYLFFQGSISKQYFALLTPQPKVDVKQALTRMADWYLVHVIGKRSQEFERFRL